ncbi:hypothetical protein [Bacillus infantis]|uniref:hypothetical protein n=1 Tax=Bacillus infantis TaxID=324767 RepID=UPI003CEBEF95
MFLKPVKVKKFAESQKHHGGNYGGRKMYTYPNSKPEDVFHIIGVTSIKDGSTDYDREYGYSFVQHKSHKVYIVAKGLGRRYKVLPEDLEVVEENSDV